MSDSIYTSLKNFTKHPIAEVRKSKVGLFIFSLLFGWAMMNWLSDPLFTQTQNYVLFLIFFAISLWVTEAIPPFFSRYFNYWFSCFNYGTKRCRKCYAISANLVR